MSVTDTSFQPSSASGDPLPPAPADRTIPPPSERSSALAASRLRSSSVTKPGVPTIFGKYEVVRELGRGAMGVVYLARDPLINRQVAIKVLNDDSTNDPERTKRFLREGQLAGSLMHANAVTIFDVGQQNGLYYMVMELVQGGSAADHLRQHGAFPWPEATTIIADVCRALVEAHAMGLIHRDIKPANIMRSIKGVVKLADFGLAKGSDPLGASMTTTGALVGTPQYMSPEQAQSNSVDPRSDIYSLGATYYALMTGRSPYEHVQGIVQMMFAHCSAPIPDPRHVRPDIPEPCAMVVARAMAKRPEDRYYNATALLTDLQSILQGQWLSSQDGQILSHQSSAFVNAATGSTSSSLLADAHSASPTSAAIPADPAADLALSLAVGRPASAPNISPANRPLPQTPSGLQPGVSYLPSPNVPGGRWPAGHPRTGTPNDRARPRTQSLTPMAFVAGGLALLVGLLLILILRRPTAPPPDSKPNTPTKTWASATPPSLPDHETFHNNASTPVDSSPSHGDPLGVPATDPSTALSNPDEFDADTLVNDPVDPGLDGLTADDLGIVPFDSAHAKYLQDFWAKRLGVPTEFTNSVGMRLVLIPPGQFVMTSGDKSRRQTITLLRPYWMAVHETTQEQYQRVTGHNPAENKDPNKPVENVSRADARDFCSRLSQLENKARAKYHSYILPTEFEWEFACRAGTTTHYHFSDDVDPAHINCGGFGPGRTMTVGSYPPNAFGLFDMHGNVAEICRGEPHTITDTPLTDPHPALGPHFPLTLRGGTWGYSAELCQSGAQDPHSVARNREDRFRDGGTGFRVIVYVPDLRITTKPATGTSQARQPSMPPGQAPLNEAAKAEISRRCQAAIERLRAANPKAVKCKANFRFSAVSPNEVIFDICGTHFRNLEPLSALTGIPLRIGLHDKDATKHDGSPHTRAHNFETLLTLDIRQLELCHHHPPPDLALIARFANLDSLDLSYIDVEDLTPLLAASKLRVLKLNNTAVKDLTVVGQLPLQNLSLSETDISDLKPLQTARRLQTLNISNTPVSDLGPLAQLRSLRKLSLSNILATDYSPLRHLAISEVTMTNFDRTKHASLLENLPRLQKLNGAQPPR